jgi:hypothetical protein
MRAFLVGVVTMLVILVVIALTHHHAPAPRLGAHRSGAINGGLPLNCFENPETEGTTRIGVCGYPDPENQGIKQATSESAATACSKLGTTLTGNQNFSTPNQTIENTYIKGLVRLTAEHITFNHDCVIYHTPEEALITIEAANDTVTNTTAQGESKSSGEIIDAGVYIESSAANTVLNHDVFVNCEECVKTEATAEIANSYLMANAIAGLGFGTGHGSAEVHREDIYMNDSTTVTKHDTIFNPENNVAIIFANTNSGGTVIPCDDHITMEEDFIAGSSQSIETCGKGGVETGASLTVKNLRIARCKLTPHVDIPGYGFVGEKLEEFEFGKGCQSPANASLTLFERPWNEGFDGHGYFSGGAARSILSSSQEQLKWEQVYWDDNLGAIAVAQAEAEAE